MIIIENETKNNVLKIIGNFEEGQKFYVDRVEKDIVVCEDINNSNIYNINKSVIPFKVRENDTIEYGSLGFVFNAKETKKRKEYIKNLVKDLWI